MLDKLEVKKVVLHYGQLRDVNEHFCPVRYVDSGEELFLKLGDKESFGPLSTRDIDWDDVRRAVHGRGYHGLCDISVQGGNKEDERRIKIEGRLLVRLS